MNPSLFAQTPALAHAFVHGLADAARTEILPCYRQRDLAVEDKSDLSPVTRADRAAEAAMRALIAATFPDHGIVGEEYGNERADAEWVWVLDPIDGTKSFLCGRPTFVTLIGLLHRGVPVLGVIDQAVLGERWLGGSGLPTTRNGTAVKVAGAVPLGRARLGSTGPQYFGGDGARARDALVAAAGLSLWGGDGYLYALLAQGGLDVVLEQGLKLHDFAALAPVVQGAGGVMTDWEGQPLTQGSDGNVLACSHASLHREARACW